MTDLFPFLLFCGATSQVGSKLQRLTNGERGQVIVILADVSSDVGGKVRALDAFSVVQDVSLDVSIGLPLGQDIKECALAGSTGSEDGHELSLLFEVWR